MIDLPTGLLASSEPYPPDVGRLYWLESPLLDPDDPEPRRPAVVLIVRDEKCGGEIVIALRTSTERNGTFHPKSPGEGLNRDGWFSRIRTRSSALWTPDNARSMNLMLDEETFSYVYSDFLEAFPP